MNVHEKLKTARLWRTGERKRKERSLLSRAHCPDRVFGPVFVLNARYNFGRWIDRIVTCHFPPSFSLSISLLHSAPLLSSLLSHSLSLYMYIYIYMSFFFVHPPFPFGNRVLATRTASVSDWPGHVGMDSADDQPDPGFGSTSCRRRGGGNRAWRAWGAH